MSYVPLWFEHQGYMFEKSSQENIFHHLTQLIIMSGCSVVAYAFEFRKICALTLPNHHLQWY